MAKNVANNIFLLIQLAIKSKVSDPRVERLTAARTAGGGFGPDERLGLGIVDEAADAGLARED
jgi:hypothetical protein